MAKELNFTLEGVQGDLKLKYGPFNQRLYQDGREIKKQGRFNPKYYVINTNGEKEEIKVVYGFDFVHVAVPRTENRSGGTAIYPRIHSGRSACVTCLSRWVDWSLVRHHGCYVQL